MKAISSLLIFSFFIIFLSSCLSDTSTCDPAELKCEYRQNPLGVESTNPRLSWIVVSDERNQIQTGYEILVASAIEKLTEDGADMWKTGFVKSDNSIHIK